MRKLAIPLLPQIAGVHLVSHVHMMVLPALLPILPALMGVGFVELGFALGIFNIVSAVVQTPLGFAVDHFGARRVLTAGLLLGSLSFLLLGIWPNYFCLMIAMALAGVANGVYHPADYAMLSNGIETKRMGRAFSIHTFAGYLGGAITPALLLGIAALINVRWAFAAATVIGLGALALLCFSVPWEQQKTHAAKFTNKEKRPVAPLRSTAALGIFTPAIGMLTLMFVLLSLSTGSIDRFSVSALVQGYDVSLSWANAALTAFLFASAFGVLAGGFLADKTRRHGYVAAAAFALAGLLVVFLALGWITSNMILVIVLGAVGFLAGVIAPSRDMLVRAAAPAGSEGKAFGVVSTGFNIGGIVGPLLYGWLLDHSHASAVFWCTVAFMAVTVLLTLWQEFTRTEPKMDAPAAA